MSPHEIVSTDSALEPAKAAQSLAATPEAIRARQYERIVKWIPLVVPCFAVMLATGAYLILGSVL